MLLGKLRVVRRLGRGGMGSVYEVEHTLTRHRRALKVVHPALAREPDLAARFVREVGVAARIASPHVVETYDAGTLDDGTPYALMELLEGETLASRLERVERFEAREAISLVAELCQGVSDAHRAGILHRDLKPENVFLVPGDGGGARVRILDFGIARPITPGVDGLTELTVSGAVLGTPHYIAPEYAMNETPDERVDVYAIGVILFELLAGRKPFDEQNLFALLAQIVRGEPAVLRDLVPDVPDRLDAIVSRAMARDPARRYPSAAWLLADLRALGDLLDRTTPLELPAVVPTDVDDQAMTTIRTLDLVDADATRVSDFVIQVQPALSPAGGTAREIAAPATPVFRDRRAIAIIVAAIAIGGIVGTALALVR
ncbi:MAG: serine/threonine protein kinase [Deltaproteobacteria bacterium]|nr:serine/threonine protein kinase [Deltaproteobacteria bacterium]